MSKTTRDVPKYQQLGLTSSEYEAIGRTLGREPEDVELAIYSLMWSEHCGYKHSRSTLKKLPTTKDYVLQGPGENAGVIDIGEGKAIAIKIESHNHPSAVEPFQGAATGVGGIVRDIFAMGARPLASLNSLRFGDPTKPRQKYLFEGVVSGIGSYGNCLGVPTVAGEVYFEDSYEGNCLVNAMTIGILPKSRLITAKAKGISNLVVLMGSKTGRDGIGGASVLASQEFDETLQEKRPSVQVGDPFTEKLLIEACLELLDKNLLAALGDLGAAGITSSASEMASRGGVGIDIDVSKVPLREPGMSPSEIMISESQERMLAVVEPKMLSEVEAVCNKWGIPATVIGKITETSKMDVYDGKEKVGSMPVISLTDEAPIYDIEPKMPEYIKEVQKMGDVPTFPEDMNATLLKMIGSPNLCSRGWIWRQYDHQVQTNTVVLPGSDSAVLRLKGTKKGLALTVDGNGRYCYLDPFMGTQIAVAEAARNIVATGATPMAVTDCLNFGNPEKSGISWQFRKAIDGMAQACRHFDIPVVSGNVSFYNESFGKAIYPTPTVGMIGLLDDVEKRTTTPFKDAGDLILLIGQMATVDGQSDEEIFSLLGGSEYLKTIHKRIEGLPPELDLDLESRSQDLCLEAIKNGILSSAHDISDGGLVVALLESCLYGDIGAKTELAVEEESFVRIVVELFNEAQSRFIVSLKEKDLGEFGEISKEVGADFMVIGKVGGDRLIINDKIDVSIKEMKKPWEEAIDSLVE